MSDSKYVKIFSEFKNELRTDTTLYGFTAVFIPMDDENFSKDAGTFLKQATVDSLLNYFQDNQDTAVSTVVDAPFELNSDKTKISLRFDLSVGTSLSVGNMLLLYYSKSSDFGNRIDLQNNRNIAFALNLRDESLTTPLLYNFVASYHNYLDINISNIEFNAHLESYQGGIEKKITQIGTKYSGGIYSKEHKHDATPATYTSGSQNFENIINIRNLITDIRTKCLDLSNLLVDGVDTNTNKYFYNLKGNVSKSNYSSNLLEYPKGVDSQYINNMLPYINEVAVQEIYYMNDFKLRLLGNSILNNTVTNNSYIITSDDTTNNKISGTPVYKQGSTYYYSPTFTGPTVSNGVGIGNAINYEVLDTPGYLKKFSYQFLNSLLLDKPDNPAERSLYTMPLDLAFAPLGLVTNGSDNIGSINNTFYGPDWDGVTNYELLPKINEGNIPYLHAELIQFGMLPLSVVPPVAIQNIKQVRSIGEMLGLSTSSTSLGDSVQIVWGTQGSDITYNIQEVDTTTSPNKPVGTQCYKHSNNKFYYNANGTNPVNPAWSEGNGIWKTTSGDVFLVINKSKTGTFEGTNFDFNSYNAGASTKLSTTTTFDIESTTTGKGTAANYKIGNTIVESFRYNGTQESRTLTIKNLDSYLSIGNLNTGRLFTADITPWTGSKNNANWSTITVDSTLKSVLENLNKSLCLVADNFDNTENSVYRNGDRFITQSGLYKLLTSTKQLNIGPSSGSAIKIIAPSSDNLLQLGTSSLRLAGIYATDINISNGITADTLNLTGKLTGTTATFSDITANTLKLNEKLTGTTATFSGAITCLSVTTTSARKAKYEIVPTTDSMLELLRGVNVVYYKYKSDPNKIKHIGFIADDTDELLSGPNKDNMQIADCVGALLKAVQELDDRVTNIEKMMK
jgi:hypothetical protein